MQRPRTDHEKTPPARAAKDVCADFGSGDVVRLNDPKALHYGAPKDWITTGVGTVIVGGTRLGYGSEISGGGEYLLDIGGRRLWAKETELMLVHGVPRAPVEEEIELERLRRSTERGKRRAAVEAQEALATARMEALKVRTAAKKSPRYPGQSATPKVGKGDHDAFGEEGDENVYFAGEGEDRGEDEEFLQHLPDLPELTLELPAGVSDGHVPQDVIAEARKHRSTLVEVNNENLAQEDAADGADDSDGQQTQ